MKTRCRRCRKLIPYGESMCDKCKKAFNADRKTGLKDKEADDLLKTARWQNLRRDIIRRDHGHCILCFLRGIITYKLLQVHHIVKRTQDVSLAFEPTNLVTLCRDCHEEVELLSVSEQRELLGEMPSLEDFRL